jgi:hypothetical protein
MGTKLLGEVSYLGTVDEARMLHEKLTLSAVKE